MQTINNYDGGDMRTAKENQEMFGRVSIRMEGEPRSSSKPPPEEYCEAMRRLRELRRDAEEAAAARKNNVWDE